MFKTVLVVCHANICRSPMAEALFRADPRVGAAGIEVRSAGLAAVDGRRVDRKVGELLAERGIDVSEHRSRRLDLDMIQSSQLVLVMEDLQLKGVVGLDPSSRGKVHLLGKWDNVEIYDPHRQEESVYRGSAELVERSVANWIKKIC